MSPIEYTSELSGIDWAALTRTLAEDRFDNGRTPQELRTSFENSFAAVFAIDGEGRVIGKGRVLSDGVCNAYLVDLWTYTPYRRRGVAREIIGRLASRLAGQHLALFTDEAPEFYRRLGFVERGVTFERVIGNWLGR
jgi:predicted GNAT family acetyltransferase